MSASICSDCGKELGNDTALSWHREGVHDAEPRPVTASSSPRLKTRVSRERGESSHTAPVYGDETQEADESEITVDGMKADLRGWGIGLILIGIAQLFIPFLDPIWALVVVPLGALSLIVGHRVMFIPIGVALVAIGLLNIFGGGFGGWTIYGGAQIYWGVQEFSKFGKYADAK